MIVFPEGFVQLEMYPGYYWNINSQSLYSCKSGVLKPLKYNKGGFFNGNTVKPGYYVSVRGRRLGISKETLLTIKHQQTQIFPME